MKVFLERTSQPIRSIRCLGIRCLWQWSPQLSALAGTAAVIAIVISGSLGVGDSIRHRLRQMASQRLGGIVAAIVGEQPFEKQFSERLYEAFHQKVDVEFPGCKPELIPAIVGEITVERPAAEGRPRVSTVVTLLGCDRSFDLHYAKAASKQKGLQLSQRVVDLLELKVGDPIVLRMNEQSIVPADTPLGRR